MLFHDAKLACERSMLSILNVHRLSERLALVLNIWMKEYVAVMGLYMIITGQAHDVNGTLCRNLQSLHLPQCCFIKPSVLPAVAAFNSACRGALMDLVCYWR